MELHPILENDTVPNPNLWYVVSAMGDCPSMRVGHTCVHVKGVAEHPGKVYVIAGANPSGPFNDTYVLDLSTLSWDTFETPGLRPRYEHVAFVPETQPAKIYVFGGADQTGNMNDIQVLDTTTNMWSVVDVKGSPPSPRTHHTTAIVGDRLIIYSGGHCGADPVADRKVHCFDASTLSWSVISIRGDSPKPRHGHAMASLGNRIYLHGGMSGSTFYDDFHMLDLDKNLWTNVRRKGMHPSPRAAHSMVATRNDVYVLGGMNQDGALEDLYKFDTESNIWSRVELLGPPPACRLDFGACVVELRRSLSDDAESSRDDLVVAGTQAQEVLERELTKPGSASSQGSRCGSESSFGSYVVSERLLADLHSVDGSGDQEEVDGACAPELQEAGAGDLTEANTKTYKLWLIHGGMDTEGEIFDDVLVYLLE